MARRKVDWSTQAHEEIAKTPIGRTRKAAEAQIESFDDAAIAKKTATKTTNNEM